MEQAVQLLLMLAHHAVKEMLLLGWYQARWQQQDCLQDPQGQAQLMAPLQLCFDWPAEGQEQFGQASNPLAPFASQQEADLAHAQHRLDQPDPMAHLVCGS